MKTCDAIDNINRLQNQILAIREGWKCGETTKKIIDGMALDAAALRTLAAQQHSAELLETSMRLTEIRGAA